MLTFKYHTAIDLSNNVYIITDMELSPLVSKYLGNTPREGVPNRGGGARGTFWRAKECSPIATDTVTQFIPSSN